MIAPEASAQATASLHATSGSSGLSGGGLFVSVTQTFRVTRLATAAESTPAPGPTSFQMIELMASTLP
ncbi:hypothetical protein GCM10027586_17260 [Kineococcus gypseus]